MKLKWFASSAALIVGAALALAPGLYAQAGAQYGTPQAQQHKFTTPGFGQTRNPGQQSAAQAHTPAMSTSRTGTFTGKVIKLQNGRYALVSTEHNHRYSGHYLKGSNLKKYVGKHVQVTGTLKRSTNTVSVTSIRRR